MSGHYLSESEAKALSGAGVGVIEGVMKLAAHGLSADLVLEYATAIADGKDPPELPMLGGPRAVTIQLHSFLADPRQYRDTYNVEESLVHELRALELSDREAAREGVLRAVASSPRIIQSGRPVRVVFDGTPGEAPTSASPLANASGITKSLSAEIAADSTRYGAFKFEAFETPLGLTQRFGVDLGQNFFVASFSKKVAISLARIASVKGRTDPTVEPYIFYVNSAGQMLGGRDIPSEYWDCTRGPRDKATPSMRHLGVSIPQGGGSRSAPTTVGK
nr:PAS-rich protein [Alternaria alternata polymycovirus 2]